MKSEVRKEIWEAFQHGAIGTGNWRVFDVPWDRVQHAASIWSKAVVGHRRLWLCWNVNDDWCLLQQKLVRELDWTPVVGWDPMCGVSCPPLVPEAIAIDFNATLRLPTLFMHVPLEFAFLWIEDKLAFWHSDLLLPRGRLARLANLFADLRDGEMAAVYSYGGLRNLFNKHTHRYWELAGCTTKAASKDQYDHGSGWWKNIAYHPNSPRDPAEQRRRRALYNEHGVGIRYWEKHYKGVVRRISERSISDGHFSVTSVRDYKRAESKSLEMRINFDLHEIANRFGFQDLL